MTGRLSQASAHSAKSGHKAHFVFLDGMRGIAALTVGWLHASQLFSLSYRPLHAFLAVDFFFCLSGFVIAYAYDDKLDRGMPLSSFLLSRLIRLYPMILCGIVIGAVVTLFERMGEPGQVSMVVAFAAASLVLLPLGLFFQDEAYPINNPIWTLFFEILASVIYGIERRFLHIKGALLPLLALIGTALTLAFAAHRQHTLETLGYSSLKMFVGGFVRVAFPFLAGALIYRYSIFRRKFSPPSLLVAIALFATLSAPIFPTSWLYDSIAIIVFFPALLIAGANVSPSSVLNPVWKLFGRLSYPFYLIHQPIVRAVRDLDSALRLPESIEPMLPALSVLAAVGCAYVITTLYDEPVRRWLSSLRAQPRPAAPLGEPSPP